MSWRRHNTAARAAPAPIAPQCKVHARVGTAESAAAAPLACGAGGGAEGSTSAMRASMRARQEPMWCSREAAKNVDMKRGSLRVELGAGGRKAGGRERCRKGAAGEGQALVPGACRQRTGAGRGPWSPAAPPPPPARAERRRGPPPLRLPLWPGRALGSQRLRRAKARPLRARRRPVVGGLGRALSQSRARGPGCEHLAPSLQAPGLRCFPAARSWPRLRPSDGRGRGRV
jgi:hypothetical protein